MLSPPRPLSGSDPDSNSRPPSPSSFPLNKFQEGYLPFEEFDRLFNLAASTTEMDNIQTANLSTILLGCPYDGLKLLLQQEKPVVEAFRTFSTRLDAVAQTLYHRIRAGGRIIFVGVGSSGRLAIDLAAKITAACPNFPCWGITGGGTVL